MHPTQDRAERREVGPLGRRWRRATLWPRRARWPEVLRPAPWRKRKARGGRRLAAAPASPAPEASRGKARVGLSLAAEPRPPRPVPALRGHAAPPGMGSEGLAVARRVTGTPGAGVGRPRAPGDGAGGETGPCPGHLERAPDSVSPRASASGWGAPPNPGAGSRGSAPSDRLKCKHFARSWFADGPAAFPSSPNPFPRFML